jgi:uncharacterized protein (DUF1501 family)
MAINRRQFIKRSAGVVTVSLVMPNLWLREARAQSGSRRKLVVIQLAGGYDGLNVVVPYTSSRYQSLRPNLHFKDSELKDAQGNSTIISSEFGLHPELGEIKSMYDAGKVAVVLGVGYPTPNLSHFLSTDIWQTANTNGGTGDGWLGKYADLALFGKPGLTAANIGGSLPKALFADKAVIPSISNFANYTYQTDQRFGGDRNNQINTFNSANRRSFPTGSFAAALATTGVDAVAGAAQLQTAVATYSSTITYPTPNPLAAALKMVAQIMVTVPEASLLYVSMGGFDHHSQEIGNAEQPTNKNVGQLAQLLKYLSEGVDTFYKDLEQHNLANDVLILPWSEFGRRPNENASFGSDHGTALPIMVIGNGVHGGIYGVQPSLETTALDTAGNMKFQVDFRSVYATVLDRWLGADARAILGGTFENIGFLG